MTATAITDLLVTYAYLFAGCVWLWRNIARLSYTKRANEDSAWWVR